MLLSDDEIKKIFINEGESKYEICFARAVEAAILAKLASAELPKPYQREIYATSANTEAVRKGFEMGGYVKTPDLYTEDQLRQAFAQGAASQLQTLQAENTGLRSECAELKRQWTEWSGSLDSVMNQRNELRAENERLTQDRNLEKKLRKDSDEMAHNAELERDALAAKLATLEADAERLDWIQQKLFTQKWNGVVGSGCATQWSIAPDYRHTVAKMKTGNIEVDFRAAIDAAKGGQHEDA